MRVAWVQDLNIFSVGGGAQLTDQAHFNEGVRRGYQMSLMLPDSDPELPYHCDFIIASNCVNFKVDYLHDLVKRGKKIIWFFHDYFCRWRLFYPMLDKCKRCYLKPRWLPILTQSPLLIWLSPLHRDSWLWSYPELADMPYALIPSAIDTTQFFNMHMTRKGIICNSGLCLFKGRRRVLEWARGHPETHITFIGGNDLPEEPLPPNCSYIGGFSHLKMNDVFNQFEALLHLPATPQPFERAFVEAYLAGCKLIANSLVGALSYDWFTSREEVAKHVAKAPKDFWDSIEKALDLTDFS